MEIKNENICKKISDVYNWSPDFFRCTIKYYIENSNDDDVIFTLFKQIDLLLDDFTNGNNKLLDMEASDFLVEQVFKVFLVKNEEIKILCARIARKLANMNLVNTENFKDLFDEKNIEIQLELLKLNRNFKNSETEANLDRIFESFKESLNWRKRIDVIEILIEIGIKETNNIELIGNKFMEFFKDKVYDIRNKASEGYLTILQRKGDIWFNFFKKF